MNTNFYRLHQRRVAGTAQLRRHSLSVALVSAALLLISVLALTPALRAQASSGLFSDDFEADAIGAVPSGWTPLSGSNWFVEQDGTHVLQQTNPSTANKYVITAGSSTWTDYVLQADVKPGANDLNQATVIMARFVDDNNHYSFLLKNHNEWYLGIVAGGVWSTLDQGTFSYNSSTFYTLALSVQGSTISGSINGTTMATDTDTSFASGMIALSARATAEFDNVLVTTSGGSPTPTPTATATNTASPTPTATATSTATPTSTPTQSPTPSPTPTQSPSPTPTQSPSPTPTPTQSPTPTPSPTPPPGGSAAQLSVTSSSSGVTVQSVDPSGNGWRAFFNSAAGGVITQNGELDNGVYTELEAQNTNHGRVQMYLQTSGSVWLSNLLDQGTITVVRNTPDLVTLQLVATNSTYHIQWTTWYFIWPDGEMYVQLQVANIGTHALSLFNGDALEIDLGGLPLADYQDQAPNAWYLNGSTAVSPIPFNQVGVETPLFGHMTTVPAPPDMGYLLDKYTTWSSQGAANVAIDETQNSYRAKDQWIGDLAQLNPGQTLTFLFLLGQRRFLTQAQSIAINADYRTPSVVVNDGTLAASDSEPAGAMVVQGFNLDVGAYVIAAHNNHVNAQLAFPTGVSTRWAPRFKVTGWTGASPTITWGGQLLTNGTDYTLTSDPVTHTLYIQLTFDVVAANPQTGQRVNAPLDIS
jgi:hypothetical protein